MEIGTKVFSDVGEARQYIRHLLAKYPLGTAVTDPVDIEFLDAVVRRHPKYMEKLSGGIQRFVVVRNRRQKATELQVFVQDGTTVQVPWAECVL